MTRPAASGTSRATSSSARARLRENRMGGGSDSRCSSTAASQPGHEPGRQRRRLTAQRLTARRSSRPPAPARSWDCSRRWRSLAWPGAEDR